MVFYTSCKRFWKFVVLLSLLTSVANLVLIFLASNTQLYKRNIQNIRVEKNIANESDKNVLLEILTTRNYLSRLLNEMSKHIGKLQCEKVKGQTSENGGWCKSDSLENSGNHFADKQLIPALSEFLKGKSVASFGDGPGIYKREILKLGQVKAYAAYDGAPYCEEVTNGNVKFMDLTVPQYGIPLYDWVLSLEVAEHIPRKLESVYLDNIFRHAREGVIISWAIPDQGGLGHINERSFIYVNGVMNANGFERDDIESQNLQNSASLWWLQKNTNVFRRKKLTFFNKIKNYQW